MKLIFKPSRLWFPILVFSLSYSVWASLYYLPHLWKMWLPSRIHHDILISVSHSIWWISVYGVIATLINIGMDAIEKHDQPHMMLASLRSLSRGMKSIIFLMIAYQSISTIGIFHQWDHTLYQGIRVAITGIIGWCAFALIQIGEVLLLQYFPVDSRHNVIDIRRRYTHIAIIKRILILLLVVITAALMLMSFEKIRVAGTAILASAGVFSTVVIFSARGLLESIFKGVQLAIAQPVRLEDTVTVNGEIGTVTSITLHHIVMTLSDRSQLIVPVSDLLDKTFKNWTHFSENIIANVVLYVKYNAPIDTIRNKFQEYLSSSAYWDREIGEVRLGDLKNNVIELKLIMGAKNNQSLSQLRNEIVEQLLNYMQAHHPGSLP